MKSRDVHVVRHAAGFIGVVAAGLVLLSGAATGANAGQDGVTFHADVEPILQRSCQACHRAGAMAPMSLVTYEEVRPWARSVNRSAEK